MIGRDCDTQGERAAFGFQTCLSRMPTPDEQRRLVALYRAALEEYQSDDRFAFEMAIYPLGPVSEGADIAELAAWTVVGNVILNLDELLTRN